MNDFLFEVQKSLVPKFSNIERNAALVRLLESQIEECKSKLPSWPPAHKLTPKLELKPVHVELKEPKSELDLHHTHYEITRVDFFKIPPNLYDNFGVPLRRKFDCMISYQWKYQDLVKLFYNDMHMKNLSVWFDIWSGMSGDTANAMATAVCINNLTGHNYWVCI